jgi:hypothetical protein
VKGLLFGLVVVGLVLSCVLVQLYYMPKEDSFNNRVLRFLVVFWFGSGITLLSLVYKVYFPSEGVS